MVLIFKFLTLSILFVLEIHAICSVSTRKKLYISRNVHWSMFLAFLKNYKLNNLV